MKKILFLLPLLLLAWCWSNAINDGHPECQEMLKNTDFTNMVWWDNSNKTAFYSNSLQECLYAYQRPSEGPGITNYGIVSFSSQKKVSILQMGEVVFLNDEFKGKIEDIKATNENSGYEMWKNMIEEYKK